MSVVLSKHDDQFGGHQGKCSMCGRPVHYPFLHWYEILICGDCCQRSKKGFIADLIYLDAIVELHKVGYGDETFDRKTLKQLDVEAAKRKVEEENAYDEVMGTAPTARDIAMIGGRVNGRS